MLKERIQKLQNRVARVMTGANYDVRSSDLLHAMSGKNLNDKQKMNKSVLIYKILNNHSAPNLKDKFIRRDTNLNNYNLRSANTNLPLPRTSTEYLKKGFGTVVLSGTPELGEGGRRGSCPSCLLLGGARGAEVPFEL
jgi:hypothetical protein